MTTDAEFRQALSLSAHDALANTPMPSSEALRVLGLLMRRLARPWPFDATEEHMWLDRLVDAGWELTAPFDPERWKQLLAESRQIR